MANVTNMAKQVKKPKQGNRYFKRFKRYIWLLYIFGVLFVVLLFVGISTGFLGFMPTFEELENPKSSLATEVYSSDGKVLGSYYIENRSNVEYSELSPNLVNALIATEDIRFYDHSGIDLRSVGRVIGKTLIGGDRSSGGGSTISQQLAKNLFPRERLSTVGLMFRKLKEWVIAIKLEKNYTKDEIITMYLNTVDFGNNSFGIKTASENYFAKPPSELDVDEAAILVGLLKATTYFNPVRNPKNALNRRNVVLNQMLKADYLSEEEFKTYFEKPIDMSNFRQQSHTYGSATYFREHLRLWLNEWCKSNTKPNGQNYNLYRDGLKIYTTIDSRMQTYAENAVKEWIGGQLQKDFVKDVKGTSKFAPFIDIEEEDVDRLMNSAMYNSDRYRFMKKAGHSEEVIRKTFDKKVKMKVFSWQGEKDTIMSPWDSLWYHKWFLHCGLISMEPQTGYVKAYVGGINYKYFQFDNASQGRRQVGSTFKPFVYTLAMQDGGYTPCTMTPNVPVCISQPNLPDWCPKNSSRHKDGEMVTLRWALANSLNYISAYLIKRFPPEAVVDLVKRMGVRTEMLAVPSISLGTMDISVKEMTAAMSTYANKGIYVEPTFVSRIEDYNGVALESFTPFQQEAMNERTAYLMIDLMRGVVTEGSAGRLRWKYNLFKPIAGKTGTTQNHSDAWFMGITPSLTTGVWVGGEMRSIHFNSMRLGQGANAALPIWAIYMKQVYADTTIKFQYEDFEKPEGVVIDSNCIDNMEMLEEVEEVTNYSDDM